jgi:hypothetical protein
MSEKWSIPILPTACDFHGKGRDLLHAANLRHETDGFTSPPKEGMLRIFMHGITVKEKCTKGSLSNLTSTMNTYRHCSCSYPTFRNLRSLYAVRQSARCTFTPHDANTVHDPCSLGPERSRRLPKSHVLHQRKNLFRVAIGMCKFKQHC